MGRIRAGGFVLRRWRGLLLVALALAVSGGLLVSSATAQTRATTASTATASTGDCNSNGVPDRQESSWSNRDDDGDGVCNGIDNCPTEFNPSQDASACAMQAVTVPEAPGNPDVPHPTYSGANLRLKGIARYGATEFKWDFGDGTSTAWTAIANPFDLSAMHVYTGSVGRLFVATLSVRNGAGTVASANYPIEVMNSTAAVPNDPAQLDVRAQMAVDDALWYLHVNETRATYADGIPGFRQPYGYWLNNNQFSDSACDAVDAFETAGSLPQGDYDTDPYVEDVQRAYDFIFANAAPYAISSVNSWIGTVNPDVNGNGIGVQFHVGSGNQITYSSSCLLALADSGTSSRLAATGQTNVYARSFGDLAQDGVEFIAYAQNDMSNSFLLGAWGYAPRDNTMSDPGYLVWPAKALDAAATNLRASIPTYVRAALPYWLANTHHTARDASNGAWGYSSSSNYLIPSATAGGILGHFLVGDSPQHPDVKAGLGFLYRDWSGAVGGQWNCWDANLGNTGAMYAVATAMGDAGLSRITDYDYNNGVQTSNSFDWYYTPPGQSQTGYATALVSHQASDGHWSDWAGCGLDGVATATAQGALVLMEKNGGQGPLVDIGGPYVTDVNSPVKFDASHSLDSDGEGLTYEWDFNYDGTTFTPTVVNGFPVTGAVVTKQDGFSTYTETANGAPVGVVHTVAVRVTDTQGRRAIATTNVVVKPPPHAPVAVLAPVSGGVGVPIQFDASGSSDIDNDPLTYSWDFNNDGQFADATGAKPTFTFSAPGVYAIGVQVTDHPDQNAVPYSAPSSVTTAYEFVTVGSAPPPVANAGGPYTSIPANTIQLDGSQSYDPGGGSLAYAWDLNDDGIFGDSTNVKPNYTIGATATPGTVYSVCLKVSSPAGTSSTSCTTVTVIRQQVPPDCAIVAPNQVLSNTATDQTFTLDGSHSSDPNGNALTYSWTTNGALPFDDPTAAIAHQTGNFAHAGAQVSWTDTLTVNNGFFTSSCTATITVLDNLPPRLTAPSDITLEANANTTASVDAWLASATATDDAATAGTSIPIANDFAPNGGVGGVGVGHTVTVTWTATNPYVSSVTAQRSAHVTVVDTTAPSLALPHDLGVEATGAGGAPATFTATASDFVDGSVPVTCSPASGSTFALGTTDVQCSATDASGNTATGTFHVTVVDTTAPALALPSAITAKSTSPAGAAVAYTATATDLVDGSVPVTCDPASGSTFALGTTTVNCSATDSHGNTAEGSFAVDVEDGTPPEITPTVTGTQGDNDFYTSDVHISWSVVDNESTVSSKTGCDDASQTTDTAGTVYTCTATSAGGTASKSVTVMRDTTPPTIVGQRTPPPNAAGWNDSDVTATFTCDDATAGVATCPDPVVFGAGANQTATVTATDRAGNSATFGVGGIDVDETAPTLSGAPTTQPNANGWYRGDVAIHWTCGDAGGSGIAACPADDTIGGEGSGLTATESVSDVAGNVTAATSDAVKIDRTAPLTIASAPSGWTNAGVTVTLAATDNLSGVDATYWQLDGAPAQTGDSVAISDEGAHTLAFWSVDKAGNVETQRTVRVLIDKTAPTIGHTATPAPNAAGWNNADVTVSFQCADALSGIAFCTADQLLTSEGFALPVVGTATDNAGNSAQDTARVSIDKTAPSITAAADRAPNAAGWYSADVLVGFTCADALSGIAACPATVTLHEGKAQSVTRSVSDVAGNHASATLDGVNVDETAPVVSFTGGGTYALDQTVTITCSATDALSGVASSTCAAANVSGPAWSFGLGTTSRSASATDLAGNVGTGSVSFTVGVTCSSLKTLIGSWVTDADVAASLQAKVDSICAAANANAKKGMLGAFDNQVDAQTGKSIPADRAALLKQFVATL